MMNLLLSIAIVIVYLFKFRNGIMGKAMIPNHSSDIILVINFDKLTYMSGG